MQLLCISYVNEAIVVLAVVFATFVPDLSQISQSNTARAARLFHPTEKPRDGWPDLSPCLRAILCLNACLVSIETLEQYRVSFLLIQCNASTVICGSVACDNR